MLFPFAFIQVDGQRISDPLSRTTKSRKTFKKKVWSIYSTKAKYSKWQWNLSRGKKCDNTMKCNLYCVYIDRYADKNIFYFKAIFTPGIVDHVAKVVVRQQTTSSHVQYHLIKQVIVWRLIVLSSQHMRFSAIIKMNRMMPTHYSDFLLSSFISTGDFIRLTRRQLEV